MKKNYVMKTPTGCVIYPSFKDLCNFSKKDGPSDFHIMVDFAMAESQKGLSS
jgi:hypothetical protein